ncbi:MAG: UbiA family prenyltransferase [Candidatus Hodarchaeales archaeon]
MKIGSNLRDVYDLIRLPLCIMGAFASFTAGLIVLIIQNPGVDLITLIMNNWDLALLGLSIPFLIIGASMAINDYHDYEADRINKRNDRPLVRNPNLKPQYVLFGSLFMIFLGILFSLILFTDNLFVTLGVIIFSFISLSYNIWTKEKGLIGNATVSFSNTAPYLLTLIALKARDPDTILVVIVIAIIIFCGVMGRELVKGIMDIEGDKISDSKTFAVQYGPIRATQLATVFFVILFFLIPIPMFIKFQNNILYFGLMMTTVLILFYTVFILFKDPSVDTGKKARSYTRNALWVGSAAFFVGGIALLFA